VIFSSAGGCGGSTATDLFGGTDASVSSDGGGSGEGGASSDGGSTSLDGSAGACFDSGGILLSSMKTCTTTSDCAVAQHVASCCGGILYVGVTSAKAAQLVVCEDAWDKSIGKCQCRPEPTTTENGDQVQSADEVRVDCTNITNGFGVCRTRKR
jgi:hypothetical protein